MSTSTAPLSAAHPCVLLALTGSVASVKAEPLVRLLQQWAEVRVVASAHSLHFFDLAQLRTLAPVYLDCDEWKSYTRGDPVLHIELRKWADCMLIAPLSANSMAEIALGLCPNLVVRAHRTPLTRLIITPLPLAHPPHCACPPCLSSCPPGRQTCVARAWDWSKPLLLAPAMNTAMWLHPLTSQHLATIRGFAPAAAQPSSSGVVVIDPIAKLLACGDVGHGAMAEVADIDRTLQELMLTTSSTQPSEGSELS